MSTPLSVRPATWADFDAILSLTKRYYQAYAGENQITRANLLAEWQRPSFDLAKHTWLIWDGPFLTGYAISYLIAGTNRFFYQGVVDPDWEHLGVMSQLLSLVETAANQVKTDLSDNEPPSIATRIYSADTRTGQVLLDAGWHFERRFWQMERSLTTPIDNPIFPPNIQIVQASPEAVMYEVYQADEEIFQDHHGPSVPPFPVWQERMLMGGETNLWFLAKDDSQIAGISLCQTQREGRDDLGWVRVLGVRRPWRKQGLGKALLLYSFQQLYQRGMRDVGLRVDSENLTGATRLYESVGMQVVNQFDIYEKAL
jgi:GNAT superfamily N-acetyltransferase